MNIKTKHKCPYCNQQTDLSNNNQYRPFCCERCKLIDLGNWASENYKIEGKRQDIEDDNAENNTH